MVCMSNKSILLSLVACVEFSYYISVTVSPIILLKNCVGMLDYQAISNRQSLISLVQPANGVRLQRYSGLDTGVELERLHSNSFKKYNKNNAYNMICTNILSCYCIGWFQYSSVIKTHGSVSCGPRSRRATP